MDLADVIEDLKNIDNLEDKDIAKLSTELYKLSTKFKADVEDKPELLAEAELLLNYKERINNEVENMKNINKKYNDMINDMYHIFGLGKLNGVEIMQIASIFKNKMKKRFRNKNKYKILKVIKHSVNNNKRFFKKNFTYNRKIFIRSLFITLGLNAIYSQSKNFFGT